MKETMFDVRHLCKYFRVGRGLIRSQSATLLRAVEDVGFTIRRGETTALVGESGSGKTTIGKTVIRVYAPSSGQIFFEGSDVSNIKGKELKRFRRHVGIVFQDPISSLNPRRKVQDSISDPLIIHKVRYQERTVRDRVKELLEIVELSDEYMNKRSTSLSGGEAQRVAIARAIALNPSMVVLDEPTASLDVSVQAKILTLLHRLRQESGLSYLLITHDLTVVRNFADDVHVVYLGKIMESASPYELFSKPLHPYTKCLLSSIPTIFEEERKGLPEIFVLEGEIPSPLKVPYGCRFQTRCPLKIGAICESEEPKMTNPRKDHYVRCHRYI